MKNIILCLFTGLFLSNVQSQEIPFSNITGEIKRDKITKRTYGIEPLGSDNKFVYYLYLPYVAVYGEISHGSVENYFIAKFDRKTLAEVNKKEIILETDNKERQFHGIFHIKNNFYLFSAFQNEQHKKHYLFVQTLNKETLEAENNMTKIGEIDYSGISKYNNTYFHHEFSPDSSKILVYYNVVNKKNENLKYGMYVYSAKMELIWQAENVIPNITEGVFSYQKFRIDNDGNVYLKGTNYTTLDNYYESAKFKDRGFFSKDTYYADCPNYTTQLYKFSANGQKQDFINLSIPGKFIRSLTFVPEKNGKILCAGVYSDPGKISAKGTFIFMIDFSSKKITNLEAKEFGIELIEMGFDEKQIKQFRRDIDNKEEWDPFDYVISDVKTNDKGEKYFVAEQFIKGTKVEKSGNMIVYKTIFNYNDLFVTRIGRDNKIARIDKINKRQYILNTCQFSSYTLMEEGGNLYFMFKEFLKKDTMLKNLEEGNGYIVKLDAAGNQKRSIFQQIEGEEKPMIVPETGIQVSDNELIYSTCSVNYKDYAINKITID